MWPSQKTQTLKVQKSKAGLTARMQYKKYPSKLEVDVYRKCFPSDMQFKVNLGNINVMEAENIKFPTEDRKFQDWSFLLTKEISIFH